MKENHGRQPWVVRIRGVGGLILGSGTLLGDRHVLTCAHVVDRAVGRATAGATPPADRVQVELVRLPRLPARSAGVVAGGWVPAGREGQGDIALLELSDPVPGRPGAELRRLPLWEKHVYAFGFPKEFRDGETVHAVLHGGTGPANEWMQMDPSPASPGLRVRSGFSGAAAVDNETGYVVGMVVSYYSGPASGRSFMIPVETLLHHLPLLQAWVVGDSSVDQELTSVGGGREDGEVARRTADFFARRSPQNVLVVVTGPPTSTASATVRRAVVLSNRQLRPSSVDPAAAERDPSLPPLGSIDLALDAAGKPPRELAARILGFVGSTGPPAEAAAGDLLGDASPRSLLIDGVDESSDPKALVDDVVGPIVDRAAERDLRILVGFRSPAVGLRLALLARRIAGLREAEHLAREHRRRLEARVRGLPPAKPRASLLRIRLTALLAAAREPDPGPLLEHLAAMEQGTDRALHEVTVLRRELTARATEHQQLRGLLDAHRARAVAGGLTEHRGTGRSYRRAHDLLWAGPCDLTDATDAVHAYAEAVRRALDDRREGAPS
ncbi:MULTISPECIES: trypsin-like peptidase domain-containing protein [Micromonospora]|uniref:trypsin-like peptidase domain-containing protein n=1 Tax=Micromonospora TaxID=1873 RepID=UPI0009E1AB45|nr:MULTISPECIES: trypsin-like peptidase domain-containing protein [Micromonospora]